MLFLFYHFVEDAGKVYDVFIDPEMNDRFVFILLKTGKLLVWKFMKPSYEWEYYKIFPLCKGPGCQLTSFAYNDSTIIWCEKRASLQCYVCVAEVNYSESEAGNDESDRKFSIRNTYCLLHNCLPITIHPFKDSKFCLLPSSNRPPGLILFWSKEKNEITVSCSMFHCDIIPIHISFLSAKFIKWSNTLKQIVGNLPTICLSVFDHFSGLALKGLVFFSFSQ